MSDGPENQAASSPERYYLSTDLSALSGVRKWSGMRAVGMVESERWRDGRVGIEQRYFITSLEDVESFRRAVRFHWRFENELHWGLSLQRLAGIVIDATREAIEQRLTDYVEANLDCYPEWPGHRLS